MSNNRRIRVIHGPNLNLLGQRNPAIYGSTTLVDINTMLAEHGEKAGVQVVSFQSNHEGELVTWIQQARGDADGLIINAAAYTHTSVALHDALKTLDIPIIELHISDPEKREKFRHISYIQPVASEVIKGLGAKGYVLALEKLFKLL